MHELSIASAVVEQVRRHAPAGTTVRQVRLRIGPLRAIDPEAMALAWRAATIGTPFDASDLRLDVLEQGDELTLVSLEVEEPGVAPGGVPCR